MGFLNIKGKVIIFLKNYGFLKKNLLIFNVFKFLIVVDFLKFLLI